MTSVLDGMYVVRAECRRLAAETGRRHYADLTRFGWHVSVELTEETVTAFDADGRETVFKTGRLT